MPRLKRGMTPWASGLLRRTRAGPPSQDRISFQVETQREDAMKAGKTLAAACTAAGLGLGVAVSLPQAAAVAAELVVLTNQGATPGVRELAAAFERASGHKVTVIQEDGAALERRLNSNGPADLITSNPAPIEELIRKGKVVAGTATPFVLAGLGLSVRAGAAKPEAYQAALLAAKSIGYSRGCSGTHAADGIAELGLAETLRQKTVFTGGGPVVEYL